mgnify:CR=1 FL=1
MAMTLGCESWLTDNWDPDLTVGEWWERLGSSGWAAPALPANAYGKGLGRNETIAVANRIVYDLVDAAGGSISAEHGIGQLKRGELRRYKSGVEVELMARVKAALDPDGIMNPGKVL